jgi:hypothetical protein
MVAHRAGSGTPTPAETTPDQLLERVETWTDPEEWRYLFRQFDEWRMNGTYYLRGNPEEDTVAWSLEIHEWECEHWNGSTYLAWARAKFTADLDAINAGVRALAPELLGDVPIVELDHRRPGDDLAAGAEAIAAARGMKRLLGLLLAREAREVRHDAGARTEGAPTSSPVPITATQAKREEKIARAVGILILNPDWTDKKIAEAVGVHPGTLSRYESFRAARKAAAEGGKVNLRRASHHRGNSMDEYATDDE